jgi:hypothetical protein
MFTQKHFIRKQPKNLFSLGGGWQGRLVALWLQTLKFCANFFGLTALWSQTHSVLEPKTNYLLSTSDLILATPKQVIFSSNLKLFCPGVIKYR